jgi:hypothetical protein
MLLLLKIAAAVKLDFVNKPFVTQNQRLEQTGKRLQFSCGTVRVPE